MKTLQLMRDVSQRLVLTIMICGASYADSRIERGASTVIWSVKRENDLLQLGPA